MKSFTNLAGYDTLGTGVCRLFLSRFLAHVNPPLLYLFIYLFNDNGTVSRVSFVTNLMSDGDVS